MARTLQRIRLRQEVRSATPLLDSLLPGSDLEDDSDRLDEDLDILASILSLHKAADRSIKYFDDLPTIGGKKRGLKELAEDLQEVVDWIGPLLDDEPDLTTAITVIVEAIVVSVLANRRQSAVVHLASSSLLIDGDVASHEIPIATSASDETAFRILRIYEFEAPAQNSVFAVLEWTSVMNAGTGLSKWMLSELPESVGGVPSGGAKDVTDELVAKTFKNEHARSGTVPDGAIPSGDFRLLLVGKPDAPGGILTASLLNASKVELNY